MIQFLLKKVFGLLGKLMLNEEYVYDGESDDLENKILALKTPIAKKIGDKQYKLEPHYSLGTLIAQGRDAEGINVTATLKEINANKQFIQFTTDIRVEHLFIFFGFSFAVIGFVYSDQPKWAIPMILGLWIVFHLWFQWVYRVQEKSVVNKAVKNLGLSKRLTKTS